MGNIRKEEKDFIGQGRILKLKYAVAEANFISSQTEKPMSRGRITLTK